jgi:hypothetical protein
MALGLIKVGAGLVAIAAIAAGYRVATKPRNDDFRNYEVKFQKLGTWKELPHNPNTLLLMFNPKTNALIRCSATQVVDDSNPEPDMDTENIVKRVVDNAQQNQAEWKTEQWRHFDNGRVDFSLFRKTNSRKTIIGAMAVRGNTTMIASISNSGSGAKALLEDAGLKDFYNFLSSVDLVVTDKWIKIHEKYE